MDALLRCPTLLMIWADLARFCWIWVASAHFAGLKVLGGLGACGGFERILGNSLDLNGLG